MDKMQTFYCLTQDHFIFIQYVKKFNMQFPKRTL